MARFAPPTAGTTAGTASAGKYTAWFARNTQTEARIYEGLPEPTVAGETIFVENAAPQITYMGVEDEEEGLVWRRVSNIIRDSGWVETIAELHLITRAAFSSGARVTVKDATDDPTVSLGSATYIFSNFRAPNPADRWTKVSEQESMELAESVAASEVQSKAYTDALGAALQEEIDGLRIEIPEPQQSIAAEGQTDIPMNDPVRNANNFLVFVDGVQQPPSEWEIVDETILRFFEPLEEGMVVYTQAAYAAGGYGSFSAAEIMDEIQF